MTRRPHGTGSVYYDADRDRWVGTYEAGWTTRGTRRRRKITAPTERAARTKLLAALRSLDAEAPTTGRPTVKRWADDWLELTQRKLRPTTWATNRSTVTKWIVPTIGHKRIDRLVPADIRAVTRAILDAGLAPSSARRAQSVLEKMLRDARSEGHTVPPNVLDVDGIEVGENNRDAIPLADALALLDAASTLPEGSRWVAAFLQGLRPAEARGLTWDAINLDNGTIDVSWQLRALPYKIPRDRTSGFRVPDAHTARQVRGALHLVRPKTAAGRRIIPLVPWMTAALITWRTTAQEQPHGLVWPGPDGNPRTDADDQTAWRELCDQANVRHPDGRRYALYEARHACATLLKEAGVDDQTIVRILGHASILSSRAYLHTDDKRTREALEGLAARLGLTAPQIGH